MSFLRKKRCVEEKIGVWFQGSRNSPPNPEIPPVEPPPPDPLQNQRTLNALGWEPPTDFEMQRIKAPTVEPAVLVT